MINPSKPLGDSTGFSLIEVVVSLVLFAVIATSLTHAVFVAGRSLEQGKSDTRLWGAVHFQMESITADGYDGLSSGSATVDGYPMKWVVQGTDPKRVVLEVTATRFGTSVRDTFVTYVADLDG